jgi:hypothetical protein
MDHRNVIVHSVPIRELFPTIFASVHKHVREVNALNMLDEGGLVGAGELADGAFKLLVSLVKGCVLFHKNSRFN